MPRFEQSDGSATFLARVKRDHDLSIQHDSALMSPRPNLESVGDTIVHVFILVLQLTDTKVSATPSSNRLTFTFRGIFVGLSMALQQGSEFVNGSARDTNLDTYTPLRMGDVPEIVVELTSSNEAPVGLGEPATTVVAPAIANAIFAASGARVRHLPIRPEAVRQALNIRS